jgi:N-acetylneuraminic acid mutarotase
MDIQRSRITALMTCCVLTACVDQEPVTSPAVPEAEAVDPTIDLAVTASNTWLAKAPMKAPYRGLAVNTVTNASGQPIVYAFGGDLGPEYNYSQAGAGVNKYNVATNTWTSEGVGGGYIGSRTNGFARIGKYFYITGGFDLHTGYGLNHAWSLTWGIHRYNTESNTMVTRAWDRPTADGVTGVIGNRIYILIGTAAAPGAACDQSSCPLAGFRTLYRYDPASNTLVTRRASPHFHRNAAAGVINGKFYVAGGYDDKGNATRALDVYNPATDTWATKASLPATLSGLKGTVVQGKLFVIATQATYAYNPATNSWAAKAPPPPNTAAQSGGAAATTVTLNGQPRIVVVGGNVTSAGPRPTSLYTP